MQKFFEPASVVLIGVSRQTGPGAYNNLEMMLRYGYRGRIHLVHPKVPEILGVADLCPGGRFAGGPGPGGHLLGAGAGAAGFYRVRGARHQAGGGHQPGVRRRRCPGPRAAGAANGPGPAARRSHPGTQHHGGAQPLCRVQHRVCRYPPGGVAGAAYHGGPVRGFPGGGLVVHRPDGEGHRRGQRRRRGRGGCPGVPGERPPDPDHRAAPGGDQAGPAVS